MGRLGDWFEKRKSRDLIGFTRKTYGDELPKALHQFRFWFPNDPEGREKLALLAIYVEHHRKEIEESFDPELQFNQTIEQFGLDPFVISFVFSALDRILKAREKTGAELHD